MKNKIVWVTVWSHKHGIDVGLFPTQEKAEEFMQETLEYEHPDCASWDEVHESAIGECMELLHRDLDVEALE